MFFFLTFDGLKRASLNPVVGTTNKSTAAMCAVWSHRKGRQPGECGPRRLIMYLATVDWAMSIPSFSNSP